jgi:hypothetical protein
VVQLAALDPIHERPSLVWAATVDHVLDRLPDEGRRQPVGLADLMQSLPHLGMDHQQPPDHQDNITNALCGGPSRSRTAPHGGNLRDRGAPTGRLPVGARGLPPGEAWMLNGSIHASGELAHQDTVLAYLQLVLRQAAEEFPAALAE